MTKSPLSAALLAIVVLAASTKSYSLYVTTLDYAELMPATIAAGQAHAPNQYRVMVPLLWKAAVARGYAPDRADRAIVGASIVFCYAALAGVLYAASRSVPITSLCLLAFYGAAASGFWVRNRDMFFDVGFTAIGMGLVIAPKPKWSIYALVSALASLNRETWPFSLAAAGLFCAVEAGGVRMLFTRRQRDAVGLTAAAIVTIGVLVAVRATYGIRPYHYGLWQYPWNVKLLLIAGSLRSSIGQAIWFAGSGVFVVWLIFAGVRQVRYPAFVAGFMASMIPVSFLISNWAETRIFMPAYAVLLVSIAGGLSAWRYDEDVERGHRVRT